MKRLHWLGLAFLLVAVIRLFIYASRSHLVRLLVVLGVLFAGVSAFGYSSLYNLTIVNGSTNAYTGTIYFTALWNYNGGGNTVNDSDQVTVSTPIAAGEQITTAVTGQWPAGQNNLFGANYYSGTGYPPSTSPVGTTSSQLAINGQVYSGSFTFTVTMSGSPVCLSNMTYNVHNQNEFGMWYYQALATQVGQYQPCYGMLYVPGGGYGTSKATWNCSDIPNVGFYCSSSAPDLVLVAGTSNGTWSGVQEDPTPAPVPATPVMSKPSDGNPLIPPTYQQQNPPISQYNPTNQNVMGTNSPILYSGTNIDGQGFSALYDASTKAAAQAHTDAQNIGNNLVALTNAVIGGNVKQHQDLSGIATNLLTADAALASMNAFNATNRGNSAATNVNVNNWPAAYSNYLGQISTNGLSLIGAINSMNTNLAALLGGTNVSIGNSTNGNQFSTNVDVGNWPVGYSNYLAGIYSNTLAGTNGLTIAQLNTNAAAYQNSQTNGNAYAQIINATNQAGALAAGSVLAAKPLDFDGIWHDGAAGGVSQTIQFTPSGGAGVVNASISTSDLASAFISARDCIKWFIYFSCFVTCWKIFNGEVMKCLSVPQAGTAGQSALGTNVNLPSALAMAGCIIAAVITLVVSASPVLIGLLGNLGADPLTSIGSAFGYGFIDSVVPLTLLFSSMLAIVVFRMVMDSGGMVVAGIIKLLVGI